MEPCFGRHCSCCNLRGVSRSRQLGGMVDLSKSVQGGLKSSNIYHVLAANASMRGGTVFPGRRYPTDFCGAFEVARDCIAGSCRGR